MALNSEDPKDPCVIDTKSDLPWSREKDIRFVIQYTVRHITWQAFDLSHHALRNLPWEKRFALVISRLTPFLKHQPIPYPHNTSEKQNLKHHWAKQTP